MGWAGLGWAGLGWAGLGWAGLGIYMGQEYFLNKPIQRERDFGGQ